MTVELDDRYAKAKERTRRTDREILKDSFKSAYGSAGEAMLDRLTTFSRPSAKPSEDSGDAKAD